LAFPIACSFLPFQDGQEFMRVDLVDWSATDRRQQPSTHPTQLDNRCRSPTLTFGLFDVFERHVAEGDAP
jgi:hypothetical protein